MYDANYLAYDPKNIPNYYLQTPFSPICSLKTWKREESGEVKAAGEAVQYT